MWDVQHGVGWGSIWSEGCGWPASRKACRSWATEGDNDLGRRVNFTPVHIGGGGGWSRLFLPTSARSRRAARPAQRRRYMGPTCFRRGRATSSGACPSPAGRVQLAPRGRGDGAGGADRGCWRGDAGVSRTWMQYGARRLIAAGHVNQVASLRSGCNTSRCNGVCCRANWYRRRVLDDSFTKLSVRPMGYPTRPCGRSRRGRARRLASA